MFSSRERLSCVVPPITMFFRLPTKQPPPAVLRKHRAGSSRHKRHGLRRAVIIQDCDRGPVRAPTTRRASRQFRAVLPVIANHPNLSSDAQPTLGRFGREVAR